MLCSVSHTRVGAIATGNSEIQNDISVLESIVFLSHNEHTYWIYILLLLLFSTYSVISKEGLTTYLKQY